MDSATRFEKQVKRIYDLIAETGAEVSWDDHIPDPADGNLRQIDITVKQNDRLTLIECRHRKRRQDKVWVEDLDGRRRGLAADAIIGVSSSGFTKGATKKAEQNGVVLRQLSEVSIQEAREWCQFTTVSCNFIQFRDIKIVIKWPYSDAPPKQETLTITINDKNESFFNIAHIIADNLHNKIFKAGNTTTWHRGRTELSKNQTVKINGRGIPWIGCKFTARLYRKNITLNSVSDFGPPLPDDSSEATVEEFGNECVELVKSPQNCNAHFDFDSLILPDRSIFKTINMDHRKPMYMNQVSIKGFDSSRLSTLESIDIEFVQN